jgi:predicted amidophosphoribosyltransferase
MPYLALGGICACCGDETDVDENSVCERCDAEAKREDDEMECQPNCSSWDCPDPHEAGLMRNGSLGPA